MNAAGNGNTELGRFFTPAITSVDPNNEEMADRMAGLLRARVADGGRACIPVQYVVQPQLVVRQTQVSARAGFWWMASSVEWYS